MGEIVLFTSGTGSGKSTVIKEIVLDILAETENMVGMVSLEESVGDTAEKFIGMKMETRLVQSQPEDKQKEAFEAVFGDERLVLLDHQGSVSDESLVYKMEYLALMGCKHIILDHITIAVSEGQGDKTGNEAIDAMMSDLLKLVKKHNIWLGVISHLRKGKNDQKAFEEGRLPSLDDIKGSGSIKQICFDIVAFARNMIAPDVVERNTIKFRVLKARFTGDTGDAGQVCYNTSTGRLNKQEMVDFA
jgi:twinkle protein